MHLNFTSNQALALLATLGISSASPVAAASSTITAAPILNPRDPGPACRIHVSQRIIAGTGNLAHKVASMEVGLDVYLYGQNIEADSYPAGTTPVPFKNTFQYDITHPIHYGIRDSINGFLPQKILKSGNINMTFDTAPPGKKTSGDKWDIGNPEAYESNNADFHVDHIGNGTYSDFDLSTTNNKDLPAYVGVAPHGGWNRQTSTVTGQGFFATNTVYVNGREIDAYFECPETINVKPIGTFTPVIHEAHATGTL